MSGRTHSNTPFSSERRQAIREIRDRLRHDRPGPDELIDRGDIDELIPHGQHIELRCLTARLRQLREEGQLSLTDVSERSELTRAAVSRLENGWNLNPTLDTLFRYAASIGAHITFSVAPAEDSTSAKGK